MRKILLKLSLLCALTMISLPTFAEQSIPNPLVEGNQQFAFSIYKEIGKQKGNLFFSPYSIWSAFAMTAAGARDATAEEMYQALHIIRADISGMSTFITKLQGTNPLASNTLKIANGVFVQKGFDLLPSFNKIVEQDFFAKLTSVDFTYHKYDALRTINQWVVDQTNGRIKNLLSDNDVSASTRLVLTSAIYMKANWLSQFDKQLTKKAPFYIGHNNDVSTEFLEAVREYNLYSDENVNVIEIPYMQETATAPRLSMIIALPHNVDGLPVLEESLSFNKWQQWLDEMKMSRVHLYMPKYRMEQKFDLNSVMEALGIKLAFTPSADFRGITNDEKLFISKAIHQSFIEVDEQGTEAAAVTGIVMTRTSVMLPEKEIEFRAIHPFLFAIIEAKSQSILFMGRYQSPL